MHTFDMTANSNLCAMVVTAGMLSTVIILQLLVAAVIGCPTDSPIVFNVQPCIDTAQNDTITLTLDPPMVGADLLSCGIQALDNLPQSETDELLAFADNVSNPDAAMIGLAIETLEFQLETALGNICPGPGVKWSCTLVAVCIDLTIPFGIKSNNHCIYDFYVHVSSEVF